MKSAFQFIWVSGNMALMLPIPSILLPLFLLLLVGSDVQGQNAATSDRLVRFYSEQLDNKYYGDRMDGITGLAHLGDQAKGATSRLTELSEVEQNNFFRLLSLWALSVMSTHEASDWSRGQALKEWPKLKEGPFRDMAARTVLLSSVGRGEYLVSLDKTLPLLYNNARGGRDLTTKLTALWALVQLNTSVTIQTAERAMVPIAEELTPKHGNYTRHLRYLRLIGPPAQKYFSGKLESLIQNYDFFGGLTPKRALTVYTLATITYPNEPPVVMEFKNDINNRLQSVLDRGSALDDLLALGPFGCSQDIVASLEKITSSSSDDLDLKYAKRALLICR